MFELMLLIRHSKTVRWFVTVLVTATVVFTSSSTCAAQTSHPTAPTTGGCFSVAGIANLQTSALSTIRPWAENEVQADAIDREVNFVAQWALGIFNVGPSVAYYDDKNSPNAFAHPTSTHGGVDGSIRLGVNLVYAEFRLWRMNLAEEARRRGTDPVTLVQENKGGSFFTLWAILGHEAAHILQIKKGAANHSRNTELQADFLAGWFFARLSAFEAFRQFKIEEAGLYAFWSRGDYQFNSPSHHGTPQQRAQAFSKAIRVGIVSGEKAWDASVKYRQSLGG